MNWHQWVGLRKAKGHKLEGLEEALKGRKGFSRASAATVVRRMGRLFVLTATATPVGAGWLRPQRS